MNNIKKAVDNIYNKSLGRLYKDDIFKKTENREWENIKESSFVNDNNKVEETNWWPTASFWTNWIVRSATDGQVIDLPNKKRKRDIDWSLYILFVYILNCFEWFNRFEWYVDCLVTSNRILFSQNEDGIIANKRAIELKV